MRPAVKRRLATLAGVARWRHVLPGQTMSTNRALAVIALGLFWICLTIWNARRGRIPIQFSAGFDRTRAPVAFWFYVAAYLIASFAVVIGGVIGLIVGRSQQ